MKGTEDINRLLKRGVAEVIVAEEMTELLRSGKKLRLKMGFDPSAPDITLGHMVGWIRWDHRPPSAWGGRHP